MFLRIKKLPNPTQSYPITTQYSEKELLILHDLKNKRIRNILQIFIDKSYQVIHFNIKTAIFCRFQRISY